MSEQENVEQEAVDTTAADLKAAIRASFDANVEGDEDDTKLEMIGAGATFKNVARLYNEFMIDSGLAMSKEDKAAHVTEALEGRDFSEEDGYDEAVNALVSDEKGINERSAGALLRAYAKKNELEVYKKPKAEGAGRSGFANTYYDWLIANPTVSEEDAKTYIMNPENSDNVHRHLSHYQNIAKLVNSVAAQYTS